ncbi:MAG TPA: type VI secretion system baseplate subunit TssE [Stellaceae bacterium]
MASARRTQGAPTLIFERLAEPVDRRGALKTVARVHDAEGLRDSVLQQLRYLLNTRVPLDIDTLETRVRTTIDYGIPDLSAFALGNSDAMARLTRHVARTISVYEPRLRVREVVLEAIAGQRDALTARVSGSIEVGDIVEPVSFAVDVGTALNERDAD